MTQSSNTRSSRLKKFIGVLLAIAVVGVGAWILKQNISAEGVYSYEPQRDKQFILDLFKDPDNLYWLVSDPTFSINYTLDNLASSQKPQDRGNLIIKVYLHDNKPVGFTAYHNKKFYEGFILFLGVDAKYRKKGYARKLLIYAIDQLKNQGNSVIRLVTRVNNKRARALYESMGFKIWSQDNEIVRYELKV